MCDKGIKYTPSLSAEILDSTALGSSIENSEGDTPCSRVSQSPSSSAATIVPIVGRSYYDGLMTTFLPFKSAYFDIDPSVVSKIIALCGVWPRKEF